MPKPLTEEQLIDARLAELAARQTEDARLSLNTLRQIVETVDRLKADLVQLAN